MDRMGQKSRIGNPFVLCVLCSNKQTDARHNTQKAHLRCRSADFYQLHCSLYLQCFSAVYTNNAKVVFNIGMVKKVAGKSFDHNFDLSLNFHRPSSLGIGSQLEQVRRGDLPS